MTQGEKLKEILVFKQPEKEEEWLALQKRINEFLDGDNPEKEKKELIQYTEMLAMVCNGIRCRNYKKYD